MIASLAQPRIAVIGAGPCGLTTAKNLLQAGLNNFVVFDRQQRPGGNWLEADPCGHSSVYEGVRSISSRRLTMFADFDFPPGTPDYPSRREMFDYLGAYTRAFGLTPYLRTAAEVVNVRPVEGRVQLTFASGATEWFDRVIVANGHHSHPRLPQLPGNFGGRLLHSHDFKTSYPFAGERVLVLGGGNSAADIAVDISRRCGHATMSLRRGYRILPRHLFGVPSDLLLNAVRWLPSWLLRPAADALLRVVRRGNDPVGMPKPDHRLFATHPLINSELAAGLQRGAVVIRGPIEHIEGHTVSFLEGDPLEVDTIIACTGYEPSFPFLALPAAELPPAHPLFLRIFHPLHREVFFVGLFQPNGAIWPLADLQAKLVANHLAGRLRLPPDMARRAAEEAQASARHFVDSPRHSIEVDFYQYRRQLRNAIPTDAPKWRDKALRQESACAAS